MLNKLYRWYSFYAFYIFEFYDKGPSRWASKSKAIITLLILEISIVVIIFLLWFSDWLRGIDNFANKFWVSLSLAIALYLVNYVVLFRDARWKTTYKIFKETPPKVKLLGEVISFGITILIAVLYILTVIKVGQSNGVW